MESASSFVCVKDSLRILYAPVSSLLIRFPPLCLTYELLPTSSPTAAIATNTTPCLRSLLPRGCCVATEQVQVHVRNVPWQLLPAFINGRA
jgi:hypothetical protein